MSDHPQYFGNPFTDYEVGVQLDFRVKVALDLLKNRTLEAHLDETAATTVKTAFDLAEAFMREAVQREWIKPLPDHDDLTAKERHHSQRQARYQVAGQLATQRISQEESSGLSVPVRSPILG